MAYTKTEWVNGVTKVNQTNMNKIEDELELLDERTELPAVVVTRVAVGDNLTVPAESYVSATSAVLSMAGYTPAGIVGVEVNNASSGGAAVTRIALNRFFINEDNRAFFVLKNAAAAEAKVQIEADIIWIKE